jgi:hypothetical protein
MFCIELGCRLDVVPEAGRCMADADLYPVAESELDADENGFFYFI